MPINPFQTPQPTPVPQLNFTPLNQIGDAYAEYARRQKVMGAMAGATNADGTIDPAKMGTALAQIGDPQAAAPFLNLAATIEQRKQDLALRNAELGETRRYHDIEAGNQAKQIALAELIQRFNMAKPETITMPIFGGGVYSYDPNKGFVPFGTLGGGGTAPAAASSPAPQPASSSPTPVPFVSPTGAPSASGNIPATPTSVQAPTGDVNAVDPQTGRREAFLKTLPSTAQDLLRKVVTYEIDPRSLSMRGQNRDQIIAAAAHYDPTYNEQNYPVSQAALRAFNPGQKSGDAVKAFNVGIEHIEQLLALGDALQNGDVRKVNELRQWVQKNIGVPAPTNFDALRQLVGAEVTKAIVGAGGTGEERAAAGQNFATANSPAQLRGVADTTLAAMGAQLSGLKRQYETTTYRKDFESRLSPSAIKYLKKHEGDVESQNKPSPASAPQNLPKVTTRDDANAAISAARAAIAKGADPAAVNARLRAMGVPPLTGQ
jgi:hypothetical protein